VFKFVDVPRGNGRSRIASRSTVHGDFVRRTAGFPDTSNAQTAI